MSALSKFFFKTLASGSSDNPCSNSYRGIAATSEPEIQAWNAGNDLAMFISDIKAYIGVHSYSQLGFSL